MKRGLHAEMGGTLLQQHRGSPGSREALGGSEGLQRLWRWRLRGGTAVAVRGGGRGSRRAPLGPLFWVWGCPCPLPPAPPSPQPTNFTNPVYATLYMGAHNSRNSLASTDEKRELLSRGADDDLADPLA